MRKTIIALILITALISACSEQETARQPIQVNVVNPASDFCRENGGTISFIDKEAGRQGICTLPDGTKCDEWSYLNGNCPAKEKETCTACPSIMPAAEGWCSNGQIHAGATDSCGCQQPPQCVTLT